MTKDIHPEFYENMIPMFKKNFNKNAKHCLNANKFQISAF
jgi:hypothetical protein